MTDVNAIFNGVTVSDPEPGDTPSPIAHALFRLSKLQLPAKEHFENYLRYKARSNHKPKTIESSFTSIMLFLAFYGTLGKTDLTISTVPTWKPSSSTSRIAVCISPR